MRFSSEKLRDHVPPQLSEATFTTLFAQTEYERGNICTFAAEKLQPMLDALAPMPADGWLSAAYAWLTNGLFPDPDYSLPGEAVRQGIALLVSVWEALFASEDAPFDILTDLLPFDDALRANSMVAEEYAALEQAVSDTHFLTALRLGRELMPFDAASHTIGVRNVAVRTALLAQAAGLPVDVPLIAGASLCHDIGKFACRGSDATRIPYLHYYYTWQWLTDRGLEHIAHISANHSTWDLEFENLPIESLLLIYADFRVRGSREDGTEVMRIYSLAEAYDIIRSKLSNVTPEKQKRYQLVYCKLRDFELFLRSHGVCDEAQAGCPLPPKSRDAALLSPTETLEAMRDLTFENNVELMHTIGADASFDLILEQARGVKSTQHIRAYLRLFDEYNTYMTRGNKQKLLSFLYELLMNPEGDVRRSAGNIMGKVLANSGPRYRKELPSDAPKSAMAPTMLAMLDESVALWDSYIEQCLHPDHKISQKHALRISNSLKAICETLFAYCDPSMTRELVQPLFAHLLDLPETDCFVLLDALCHVPPQFVSAELFASAEPQLLRMLESGTPRWQLVALRCIEHLRPRASAAFLRNLPVHIAGEDRTVRWLCARLSGQTAPALTSDDTALIYLSNLKNAVHWTVKNTQIDMLCADVEQHPENAFHTAMHLSNLLSVSEHLPVREHAGEALVAVARHLTVDQRNEIAVDLIRELENGQEQIARFIPQYLGRLICTLPEKEIREAITFLEELLRSGTVRPATPALRTLGNLIAALPETATALTDKCLGLLLVGVAHYHSEIHQNALSVLCHDVIANESLSVELRRYCFTRVCKKLLALLSEPSKGRITFFNRASMLNHLYRFMVHCEVEEGAFRFQTTKPVAFFPGTFDPFSVGHRRIVEEIRERGFEVYLAIDEFSWSKQTLAKLLRRKIVQMSLADQWDAYVFPDEIPINIAMQQDLRALHDLFPGRELYLVVGSDVIDNASAYRDRSTGSACEENHIIVRRPVAEGASKASGAIRGKMIEFSLPPQLEGISSTRIREYIDKNLDVSSLVDPIVQAYIYEYGLYLRTPMFKRVLTPRELYFASAEDESGLPPELTRVMQRHEAPSAVLLRSRKHSEPLGWACGHSTTIATLYDEFGDVELCSAVRRQTSGRLLMIDAFSADGMYLRMLLNELLVRSLSTDHTYALCHATDDALCGILRQLGFVPVVGGGDLYCVDMRAPMVLIEDLLLRIKPPYRDSPEVLRSVGESRPKLRNALTALYPGKLLLCFDAEMLNQSLMFRVQRLNGVLGESGRRLGKHMCVPYGKILSNEVVPNTVTKTLHVDKSFAPDGSAFSVVEYPGYSSLQNQVRTIKAFRRPVILVDDLLHKGYRIAKLNPLFERESLEISAIVVGILSGRGRDLMRSRNRQVDCEYFIPNLHYWVTESLLYPFIGGDSVSERPSRGRMLTSVNLILPYFYPRHFADTTDAAVRELSHCALTNAHCLLRALERTHRCTFNTALTLRRLGEAVEHPRLPDRGNSLKYDFSIPASAYLEDDLLRLERIRARGGAVDGI